MAYKMALLKEIAVNNINIPSSSSSAGDISPSSDSSTLLSPSPKSSLCNALVLNNNAQQHQPYNYCTTNTTLGQEYPHYNNHSELSTCTPHTDAAAITSSSSSTTVNNLTTTFERRTSSSTTSSSAASITSGTSPSSRFGAMTSGGTSSSAFGPPGVVGSSVNMSLVPNNNNRGMINLQNANTVDHSR